jgi:hypothetical protein
MRLGERGHQLGLRSVRVLELVDEHVSVPPGDLRTRRWRLPDELERQRHLVTEIDEPVGCQ